MNTLISAKTQAQAVAQLGFLEQFLVEAGWRCRLVEPDSDMPVAVLLAGARHDAEGRARSVNFAYIPVSDDDFDSINLLQLYSPLPFRCEPAQRNDVLALMTAINLKMPMGHFGLTDRGEPFLRYVYLGATARLIESDTFMEAVTLFLSMQDVFSSALERVATGQIGLAEARVAVDGLDGTNPMSPTPPRTLLQVVSDYFEANEWPFELVQDSAISSVYNGNNGAMSCFVQTREEEQQFIVYTISPIVAPTDKLAAMAEFITRANYGLFVGNFELDYNDGEVRFKTSLSLSGVPLTPSLIGEVMTPNLLLMDRYLPGIDAVAQGQLLPQAAIDLVED